MSELLVWWDATLVGVLEDRRGSLRFTYAGFDSPMISVAMPPATRPYGDAVARPFFAGLLPEGENRRMIAYDLGLGSHGGTDLELLAALGRECAGALVILPRGSSPRTEGPVAAPTPLSEGDIARKLRELPVSPLGVDDDVRVSLPGVQPKLLLTRHRDGSWWLPTLDAPSTHILKPPSANFPDSVPNEVFCMALAATVGLRAAPTDLVHFEDIPTLVSSRYDRSWGRDGELRRLHQEDGCQALSIDATNPRAKYQQGTKGPSLARIARTLDAWASSTARTELLDHVVLNVIVGNADFHGKNISFLHDGRGVQLAPIYDVMSTVEVRVLSGQIVSSTLGMSTGSATSIVDVTVEDVLDEATAWGLPRRTASERIAQLLDRMPEAIAAVRQQVPAVPAERVAVIAERATQFGAALGR